MPFLLAKLSQEPSRLLGIIDDVRLELLCSAGNVGGEHGGFVLVLDNGALKDSALEDSALEDSALEDSALEDSALEDSTLEDSALEDSALEDSAQGSERDDGVKRAGSDDKESFLCAGDLFRLEPGATLDCGGARVLWMHGTLAPEPPPHSWSATPPAPFAPFEEAPAGSLPVARHGLIVEETSETEVEVCIGDTRAFVPRYWLARFLFRLALHGYQLGYVETYGGLWYDDRCGDWRLGLRSGSERQFISVPTVVALQKLVEDLYRAVAPRGYRERID